ncbi:hypothetical protein F0U44_01755 [Nocardioides humilatus]|uniref:Calx-beta domain-containing protein n=1 Tax=Nocardioides humilatus TaxID=2607660 RepID=A0A5B1LK15_9ACTN|nr:Calx-beta domain-containing protein [Nocardioides humilatus]KAA1421075.1 hypothetical protein F0U44_01755 [Nocardioides humilatus]
MKRFSMAAAVRRTGAATALTVLVSTASLLSGAAHSPAAASPPPVISIGYSDDVDWEGDTGTHELYLRFDRTGDLTGTSSAKVTLGGGTATAGTDYTATKYVTTITFPAGENYAAVAFKMKGDVEVEPDETFDFTLSDPVNATIGLATDTVTILNDDTNIPPAFFMGEEPFVEEGDSGTQKVHFTIVRYGSTATKVSVKAGTTDGNATAPSDYKARKPKVVKFAVGQRYAYVDVIARGDLVPEDDEFFNLVLTEPVGASIVDGLSIAVLDNDDSSATPTFSFNDDGYDIETDETDRSHPVAARIYRDGNLQEKSTVTYATTDGTAVAPDDYTAKTGVVTFKPGERFKDISVTVKGDRDWEYGPPDWSSAETFSIDLSAPTNGVIGDGHIVVLIFDDEH